MTPLEELKILTGETEALPEGDACAPIAGTRAFTDAELGVILGMHFGRVREAAYDICLQKAVSTKITMAGMTTAEQQGYWLRRAAALRTNQNKAAERADMP